MIDRSQARKDFAELIPRLRRFARGLTGKAEEADDLVQDTLERAWRRLDQFQPGTRLDSWLFRIAQTVWIDQVRARRSRPVLIAADEGGDPEGIDGRDAFEARLSLAQADRILRDMPQEQRIVALLVLVEGYSYREAAELLGVPEGTVTSRLFRARAHLDRLARSLAGQGDPP